jgi:hypothetical protein
MVGDQELDKDSTYTMAIPEYVWRGGNGYDVLQKYDAEMYDTMDIVLMRVLSGMQAIHESDIVGDGLVEA